MDLSPLHIVTVAMFSLGATHMAHAWWMHRSRMPHIPSVLGLAACMHFMYVTKDYLFDTFRALVRFGLLDMGLRLGG